MAGLKKLQTSVVPHEKKCFLIDYIKKDLKSQTSSKPHRSVLNRLRSKPVSSELGFRAITVVLTLMSKQ